MLTHKYNFTIDQAKEMLGLKQDQDLAAALEVTKNAVSNWRAQGFIPPHQILVIMTLATLPALES